MNKTNFKAFIFAAGIRAIKTFAQTAVGMITVGAAFSEVEWIAVVSVAGVAAVLSILTSLTGGLPELDCVDTDTLALEIADKAEKIEENQGV